MRKLAVGLLVAALAAAGVVAGQNGQDRPGTFISGRVVSAATGQPIAGARVSSNVADVGLGATTDATGSYHMDTHGAGRFVVRASAPAYAEAVFGDDPGLGPLIVSVTPGRNATGVDFALRRGATIAGRAIDDAKEPLVRARVTAVENRWSVLGAERQFMSVASTETDDRGEFRLIGLAPGEYAIAVHDRASVTFAPSTTSIKDARRVPVASDQTVEGVAIQVRAGASGSINGHVVGAVPANSRIVLRLAASDAVPPEVSSPLQLGGSFVFDNIAPGRYWLVVRPQMLTSLTRSWARVPVVVAAGAETEQVVTLEEGATITGRVTGPSPAGRDISLAPLTDPEHPEAARVQVRSSTDGTFRLQGIPPGRYRWLRTQEATFQLSIYEGTSPVDIADVIVTVRAGDAPRELRVEMPGRGSLTGSMTDRDGKPTKAGGVIVAASDSRYWNPASRRLVLARADQNSVYAVPRLPAGEYLVTHVTEIASGQLWDAAFLRKALAGAAKVSVGANEDVRFDARAK